MGSGWGRLNDEQIERLRRGLERAVARQCPRWLAERREDIVQNALIRVAEAWKKAERTEEPAHSYLVKAAYTAIAGEIRALRRERAETLEELPERATPTSPAPNPEGQTAADQLGTAIRECLEGLLESRRVVTALVLAGYGRERIATLLGLEVRKVDNDRHRGLQDMRTCLDGKGFRP